VLIAALGVPPLAFAQVGSMVAQGAKATSEKARQYGDQAKAALSSQPGKAVDQAKAQVHKAKAAHHARLAKDAAKEIPR